MSDLPESGLQMQLKPGDAVTIGPDITLFLARYSSSRPHLVIRAPKSMKIRRSNVVLARHKGHQPLPIVRETTEEQAPARRVD